MPQSLLIVMSTFQFVLIKMFYRYKLNNKLSYLCSTQLYNCIKDPFFTCFSISKTNIFWGAFTQRYK